MLAQDAFDADVLADEIVRLENEYLVADEGAAVTQHWRQLIQIHQVKGKTIHDANIVASMLSCGVRCLLTENTSDFARYEPRIEVLPL